MLCHLEKLSDREIEAYNEQIRERTEAQHSLRYYLQFQQNEYCDAFKDLNSKMRNIEHERDELQRRMIVRNDAVLYFMP
jgi:hypothetical protein